MRRLVIVALIALIGVVPFTASAQTQATLPTAAKSDPVYPLVLAAGALAGVVGMNSLTWGVGTLPLAFTTRAVPQIASPAAAAASRIFVITSGVIGALAANWIYGK